MPDDNDKLSSNSVSPATSEMGLADGGWNIANGKELPQLVRPHEDGPTPPFHSPPHSTTMVKTESPSCEALSLVVPDPWSTTPDLTPGASRVPFTKREKEFLCCLIQKHVYLKAGNPQSNLPTLAALNQKSAMSSFCRVPNAAWKEIEAEYNSKDNVRQRSIKQLRKCWENLKHRGNIDPAALYSGKKLQGRTSVSGAFTLTAEGEEVTEAMKVNQVSDGFVETCMEDDNSTNALEAVPALTPMMLPTDLSMRRRISNAASSANEITDEMLQNQQNNLNSNQRAASEERAALPTLNASSISRMTTETTTHLPKSVPRFTSPSPRITNIRTVRSLKPTLSQTIRRRFGMECRERPEAPRIFSNFSMVAKTNTQKIHEMKVKLLATRIKEHESNIQRVRLQMQHAQAQHDVNMRLLRTKAAWYDSHLRKLEKQLGTGDLSLVGEDEELYQSDNIGEMEMQYEEDFT